MREKFGEVEDITSNISGLVKDWKNDYYFGLQYIGKWYTWCKNKIKRISQQM